MSTRRRNPIKNSEAKRRDTQCVMIVQENSLKTGPDEDCRPIFCQLRHPKSRASAVYMFSHGCTKVNEVLAFDEGHRSWFIGNTVQSDGTLLVTTPIDPLFLILPHLLEAGKSGKFMPIDSMLNDDEFPECKRLATCVSSDEMCNVAEVKESGGLAAFRYDSGRTLTWLKLKVERLITALQQHDIKVSSGASVSSYVKSRKSAGASQEELQFYACGLISDYLQPNLAKELEDYLGVKAINDVNHNYASNSPAKKKSKLDASEPIPAPIEDYSANGSSLEVKKPDKTITAAQKKLNKIDKSGMKSLSSFFSAAGSKKK